MPTSEPRGPALGRNAIPGMMNAPQPTAKPNDRPHAEKDENLLFNPFMA